MSKIKSVLAVSAAAAVLVGAGAVSANAATAPRHSTALRVTSAKTVEAPKMLQPGIAHLRNTGKGEIGVLQQKKAGLPTLLKDLKANGKSGSDSRLFKDFTLLAVVAPRSDAFVPLARGTVFVLDADLDHYTAKEISSVSIVGPHANAVVPASSAVTVSRDNLLHVAQTFPTSGYLHLRDRSSVLQEILLFEVGKKVTAATLKNFIAHPSYAKLEQLSPKFDNNDIYLVAGGTSLWMPEHSKPGRLVLLNTPVRSLSTTKPPTLHKGQARVVTVGS